MLTLLYKIGSRLRLLPMVACVVALLALNGGTAFAVSADISPRNRTICRYNSINFTITWGGIPDFSLYWDNGVDWPPEEWTANAADDAIRHVSFDDPGVFYQEFDVEDAYGVAGTYTQTGVNDSGVGGCPLAPAP